MSQGYHTQCPQCAADGKDTRKNNLFVYEGDGHKYCFSCSYYEPGPAEKRLANLKNQLSAVDAHIKNADLSWPKDYSTDIPIYPKNWLRKYELTDYEMEKYKIGYSLKQELLIFPVFDETNNLILWTDRNFQIGSHGSKWIIYGSKSDIMHIIGKPDKDLIIVEDPISAIKVARTYQAMCLYGSTMPVGMLKTLSERFETVGIWPDPDKKAEGVRMALRASQFISAYSIHSQYDKRTFGESERGTFRNVKVPTLLYGYLCAIRPEDKAARVQIHSRTLRHEREHWVRDQLDAFLGTVISRACSCEMRMENDELRVFPLATTGNSAERVPLIRKLGDAMLEVNNDHFPTAIFQRRIVEVLDPSGQQCFALEEDMSLLRLEAVGTERKAKVASIRIEDKFAALDRVLEETGSQLYQAQ